jgi:molybdopterin molybdotransferase
MISVTKAKEITAQYFKKNSAEKIPLISALNRCIATQVMAQFNIPGFDNSAMDGYAISIPHGKQLTTYTIVGEIQAGATTNINLSPGEAMRIFTGAMLPYGANAVVMQEKIKRVDNTIIVEENDLKLGLNIRTKGSQTQAGDTVFHSGKILSPGAIGFLASIGIAEVEVFKKPNISIIVTGKEIISPGQIPAEGEVFECNSYSISALLQQYGIETKIQICDDNLDSISNAIKTELRTCNMLILTGGISVGDYDFVFPALQQNGVNELFYKVKQKPAKPLFFGEKSGIPVWALPGNPGSVLTACYVYVLPLIRSMLGYFDAWQNREVKLIGEYNKKPGLTHFVKGFFSGNNVEILPGQESYRMDAFAQANCLIEFDEELEFIGENEKVKIIEF